MSFWSSVLHVYRVDSQKGRISRVQAGCRSHDAGLAGYTIHGRAVQQSLVGVLLWSEC